MARKGSFPSTEQGKRVIERWGDVQAALQPTVEWPKPSRDKSQAEDDLDDIRKMMGLQPKQGG